MSTAAPTITCRCNQCSEPILFGADDLGQTVECPHCRLDTILYIPPTNAEAAPRRINLTKPTTAARPKTIQPIVFGIQALQLAVLLGIGGILYSEWHQKQLASDGRPMAATVPKWEYATFEYRALQFDEFHPRQVRATYLHRDSDKFMGGEFATNGIECSDLTILLNAIGIEGWELVLGDGGKYIVKRPYNQTSGHDFYVTQEWKNLKR